VLGFRQRLSVCLSDYPHDISKTAATRITKHNVEMFHHGYWKLAYFAVKRLKVKATRHKKQCRRSFLHSCECGLLLVEAMESSKVRPKGSNVRSSAVDVGRMKPDSWLGLVLYVSFSGLTLMIRWQKGYPTPKPVH